MRNLFGQDQSFPLNFGSPGLGIGLFLGLFCQASVALEISQVRASQTVFDPSIGESVEVRFVLSQDAYAKLRIFDGRDVLVREIRSDRLLPAGESSFAWDGTLENGEPVPSEAYRYVIHGVSPDGVEQIHDLSELTGDESVSVRDVQWDPEAGRIKYRLAEAARVSIYVGLKNSGPLLDTVVELVPRPGGENAESWDGRDHSDVLDLSMHPQLQVRVIAQSLSANALLVGTPVNRSDFVDLPEGAARVRGQQLNRQGIESSQPPLELTDRYGMELSLDLPSVVQRDSEGVPIVSGLVPIRMDVPAGDRQRVLNQRFEPVFYVDGIFAFENEIGYLPFTWLWDADRANEGVHYVTANLLGYNGSFGMATLKVRVQHTSD